MSIYFEHETSEMAMIYTFLGYVLQGNIHLEFSLFGGPLSITLLYLFLLYFNIVNSTRINVYSLTLSSVHQFLYVSYVPQIDGSCGNYFEIKIRFP